MTEGPAATIAEAERLRECAKNSDWVQVVLNGGPPCFHREIDRFCFRAERWLGHGTDDRIHDHAFVSFEQFVRDLLALVRPQEGSADNVLDIYVPGRWRCPQCKFELTQATLFVRTGEVGISRDQVSDAALASLPSGPVIDDRHCEICAPQEKRVGGVRCQNMELPRPG